jgi:hypothetical protein
MKRLLMIVVPVLLLLGGFLVWWTQPAKVVARRVANLLQAATVEEGAGNLSKGTRGQAVAKYLADRVTLDGPAGEEDDYTHSEYTRDDLVSNYSALASYAKSIVIGKPDIASVDVDGDSATVEATVDAKVDIGGKKTINGTQKMTLVWVKNPDGWQLSKASWKETGH